jgi:hypothetical protein
MKKIMLWALASYIAFCTLPVSATHSGQNDQNEQNEENNKKPSVPKGVSKGKGKKSALHPNTLAILLSRENVGSSSQHAQNLIDEEQKNSDEQTSPTTPTTSHFTMGSQQQPLDAETLDLLKTDLNLFQTPPRAQINFITPWAPARPARQQHAIQNGATARALIFEDDSCPGS